MPQWARFLIGSASGAALGLVLALAAAIWRVGWPADWAPVWQFLQSGAVWRLLILFWGLQTGALLTGQGLTALSGHPLGRTTAVSCVAAAAGYAGVVATRTGLALPAILPDAALLAGILAASGLLGLWLQRSL